MKHRIVVLGAGYAGAYVAGNLDRRLFPDETAITVVNAAPEFVQRQRLNQLAAGREVPAPLLTDVFGGTDIGLHIGRVTAIEPDRRIVTVANSEGGDQLPYDTLVYALGSRAAGQSVPGVAEHAFDVAGRPSALRLRRRLDNLEQGDGGRVIVVGDGFTGIETATEIAELRGGLTVTLAARGELGARLPVRARSRLREACARLGIEVVEHIGVASVEAHQVVCTDGTRISSDATVWTAGFAVSPIAAASGLKVTDAGQLVVDRTMRSVSHPEVYAVGDTVSVLGENGLPLPMNCGSAGYTGRQAIEAIVGRLTARRVAEVKLVHRYNAISLGQRDGILQLIDGAGRARPNHLGGLPAVRIKAGIQRGALLGSMHPTLGLPRRRLRLADTGQRADRSTAVG